MEHVSSYEVRYAGSLVLNENDTSSRNGGYAGSFTAYCCKIKRFVKYGPSSCLFVNQ